MNKLAASNRKAHRDYVILDTIECGIELKGSEVKSARLGKVNLNDSFARLEANEIILYNTHISPYEQASYLNVEATRPRKLLLHRSQIKKLASQMVQKSFTLIPLKMYFSGRGFLKVEIALCKGKKLYDKREDIKRRETDRQLRRILKAKR